MKTCSCKEYRAATEKAIEILMEALQKAAVAEEVGDVTPAQTPTGAGIITAIIDPALKLLPRIPITARAKAMMYAIGMQESRFIHRDQITANPDLKGPALGFWQFERMGGVHGVLNHRSSKEMAEEISRARVGSIDTRTVWLALETDDLLAAVFARLLLWTDAAALPEPTAGNEETAWAYYIRNWRPGKPHRETWGRFWQDACELAA